MIILALPVLPTMLVAVTLALLAAFDARCRVLEKRRRVGSGAGEGGECDASAMGGGCRAGANSAEGTSEGDAEEVGGSSFDVETTGFASYTLSRPASPQPSNLSEVSTVSVASTISAVSTVPTNSTHSVRGRLHARSQDRFTNHPAVLFRRGSGDQLPTVAEQASSTSAAEGSEASGCGTRGAPSLQPTACSTAGDGVVERSEHIRPEQLVEQELESASHADHAQPQEPTCGRTIEAIQHHLASNGRALCTSARQLSADAAKQRRWVIAPLCFLLLATEVGMVCRLHPELPRPIWVLLGFTRYFSWRSLFNALNYLRPCGLKTERCHCLLRLAARSEEVIVQMVAGHHLLMDFVLGIALQLPVVLCALLPWSSKVHRFFILRVTATGLLHAISEFQTSASASVSTISGLVASTLANARTTLDSSSFSRRRPRTPQTPQAPSSYRARNQSPARQQQGWLPVGASHDRVSARLPNQQAGRRLAE